MTLPTPYRCAAFISTRLRSARLPLSTSAGSMLELRAPPLFHRALTSRYAGWAKIPVLDHESAGQWVAWVPEEFEDFVIVRKEKKKKVEIEEDEEEPEPPKPKKKKVKTTIEEEEETPEEPSKKKTTIVEEEKTEPKKKVTETKVEEEQTPSIKTSSVSPSRIISKFVDSGHCVE